MGIQEIEKRKMTRTGYSKINIAAGIAGQGINAVLSFINRCVFVRFFSAEYLGVNGLFSDVIALLTLTELGVGSAMIYNLYKPLSEHDERKVTAYMNEYRIFYRYVALAVTILGLCLYPFLGKIIKDPGSITDIGTIYFMFLAQTASSYLFCYKQSIILADQKQFINNIYIQIGHVIQTGIQMAVIIMTKNFLLYLSVQIVMQIVVNILLSKKADKLYPYIRNRKEHISEEEKECLWTKIRALFVHRLGAIAIRNTDSIITSAIIGLKAVGIYSNYTLIISNINSLISHFLNGTKGSIGNLTAVDGETHTYEVYRKLNLYINTIYGYFAGGFFLLANPFISIFLGKNLSFSQSTVLLLTISFYMTGRRQMTLNFKDAMGLWEIDKVKVYIEVILNIVISIVLAKKIGIDGVVIGTIASCVLTSAWVEPFVVMKYGFKAEWKKRFGEYMSDYFRDSCVLTAAVLICVIEKGLINANSIKGFLIIGISFTALYAVMGSLVIQKQTGKRVSEIFQKFRYKRPCRQKQ